MRRALRRFENFFENPCEALRADAVLFHGIAFGAMTQEANSDEHENLSDRELLVRYAATRDEAIFRLLVERHRALVWGICSRVLRCHQDREDVFQATFLRLVSRADRGSWREGIAVWLHRVAYGLALNMVASRKKRRETPIVDEPRGECDRLAAIERQDIEEALHDALLELSRVEREAIFLCYLENKSPHEAAQELGCSDTALHSRLSRARQHLFSKLSRRALGISMGLATIKVTVQATMLAVPQLAVGTAASSASGKSIPAAVSHHDEPLGQGSSRPPRALTCR